MSRNPESPKFINILILFLWVDSGAFWFFSVWKQQVHSVSYKIKVIRDDIQNLERQKATYLVYFL